MSIHRVRFITPLFSRGAYEDAPEIRPASIRGQLHWWFRALGGAWENENAIFGSVHGGAKASKIVVRVSSVSGEIGHANTLPHKNGGHASPKAAYQPGTTFDLHMLMRLGGLQEKLQQQFDRTLETWLLLGTLGLRSTRAGGSFCWEPLLGSLLRYPKSFEEYEQRCMSLINGAPLRFALLSQDYPSAEAARRVVSDTLGGQADPKGTNELGDLHHPLGIVRPRTRKTSPLRFRIASIGSDFRIAAVWDARGQVTGNNPADLAGIIKLLAKRKPALGQQLQASALLT